jgi:hypothetical protein
MHLSYAYLYTYRGILLYSQREAADDGVHGEDEGQQVRQERVALCLLLRRRRRFHECRVLCHDYGRFLFVCADVQRERGGRTPRSRHFT